MSSHRCADVKPLFERAVANASAECGGAACGLNADFLRADCDVPRSLTRLGHAVARQGMTREEANELASRLLGKYEDH